MQHTFTPTENADPQKVAEMMARLAKLKPACTRCGHNLSARELESRVCADLEVCRIRRSGASVAGFVTLRKNAAKIRSKKGRSPFISGTWGAATAAPAPPISRVEALLDREAAGETIAPDEWRPSNPYTWRPR